MTKEEIEAFKDSKFMCDRVIGGLKRHFIDRTKHGMQADQERKAREKDKIAKKTEKRLASEVARSAMSGNKSAKKVLTKASPLKLLNDNLSYAKSANDLS